MVTTSTCPRNMQGPPLLPLIDCPCTSSAVLDLRDGTLRVSSIDLDIITPHASYDNHLHSDLLEPQFNLINNHLTEEDQENVVCQGTYDDQLDFPDKDTLPHQQMFKNVAMDI